MKRFNLFGRTNPTSEDAAGSSNNRDGNDHVSNDSDHSGDGVSGVPPTLFRGFTSDPRGRGGTTKSNFAAVSTSTLPSSSTPAPTSLKPATSYSGWNAFRSSQMPQATPFNLPTQHLDAKMERNVAIASRKFGDGVQNIVISAKAKQQDGTSGEWKRELLELLGAGPNEEQNKLSHIDTLLANSKCEKFVLRCLENELPPNLIHCLRLLRVLELQHANSVIEASRQQQKFPTGKDDSVDVNGSTSSTIKNYTNADNNNGKESTSTSVEVKPLSETATKKVSQLLCLLCTDVSVGEQLRPHLFGLLALSGASYPPSGIHVAEAASKVIITFAENCLSRQLVWFIHERKMMVHMTDDVRELSGMLNDVNPSASTSGTVGTATAQALPQVVPLGLTGARAESAGLMVIALSTVIKLVSASLKFETVELVKDFESAGGYDVLQYAIYQATGDHGRKLMELLPALACCPNEFLVDDAADVRKLACNFRVFDIMGDLLMRANPLLRAWERINSVQTLDETAESEIISTQVSKSSDVDEDGVDDDDDNDDDNDEDAETESKETDEEDDDASETANVDLSNPGSLKDLAALSIVTCAKLRASNCTDDEPQGDDIVFQFDLSHELLAITLQMFADHPNNYEILEERLHILSYYLLALPCYDDDDMKNFILKTLEFVLTGVGIAEEVTPVNACVEIFSVLIQTLLKGEVKIAEADAGTIIVDKAKVLTLIAADADRLVNYLEKLLQFDQRVGPLMVESGLTTNVDTLLSVVSNYTRRREESFSSQATAEPNEKSTYASTKSLLPPLDSPLDEAFSIVCRVLKLLVAYDPMHTQTILSHSGPTTVPNRAILLGSNDLVSVKEIQDKANLHKLLRRAVTEMGVQATNEALGVFESYMSSFTSIDSLNHDMKSVLLILDDLTKLDIASSEGNGNAEDDTKASILQREITVFSMLRSLLESGLEARDAFRQCGGFESILNFMISLKGIICATTGPKTLAAFLSATQVTMTLLDAAVGMKSRSYHTTTDVMPIIIHSDVIVDRISSRLSTDSPSSNNRIYIRRNDFYLNFAASVASTGVLNDDLHAIRIVDYCVAHLDPTLKLSSNFGDAQKLQNPDAVRLLCGISVFLPNAKTGSALATMLMDNVLSLCVESKITTTLPQIAACGVCSSICNPKLFGPIIHDTNHELYPKFVELFRRLASSFMSYTDFISMLRFIAGPILVPEGVSDGRVRLPVISSSIRKRHNTILKPADEWTEDFERREADFARRLQIICDIGKHTDNVPRVKVGGDTINTIAVLMHQVRLDERLRSAAEEGRLRYLEVESIEASALSNDAALGSVALSSTSSLPVERVWAPLQTSGFSFSVWLRHEFQPSNSNIGNLYILDICAPMSPTGPAPNTGTSYLSVWYDLLNQRFNVISSTSYKGEPTCFPVSPLLPDVWHHILVTYTPAKRSMMARKSVFCIYVDGRPLEAEVKVDSATVPPNSRLVIGAPNSALAVSGVVRGLILAWELGPALLFSIVLLDMDATAIFAYGPSFPCLLWGDRPQRLSLSATGTSLFSMLAKTGEPGSIVSALKKRELGKLEGAGYCAMPISQRDDLSLLSLLCTVPPDAVIFGVYAGTTRYIVRNESKKEDRRLNKERLVNVARLNFNNDAVSTDAIVYGRGTICSPFSFKDSLRFVGGPPVLFPLVNSASSPKTLALALQLIRIGCQDHRPNLEMMQAGGGYRMLSVLMQSKGVVDEHCLDQCLSFAIHGFFPDPSTKPFPIYSDNVTISSSPKNPFKNSKDWVLTDIDAMKHLIMNHQVWDLKKYGPGIPLRLLSVLNVFVDHKAIHRLFNARRLHQIGIVKWALHLAIEAADLFTAGHLHHKNQRSGNSNKHNIWYSEAPFVDDVSVGGDPGNPFLLECKNLLRRVLTFMLTPGDLEALVESIVYTVFINGTGAKSVIGNKEIQPLSDERMLPGPTMRLHLVRLLEELIVDGVNEIVATSRSETGLQREEIFQPHIGGVASPNQPYFTSANMGGKALDGYQHPKHQQAQAFLKAFSSYLTPVWFATVLQGCREEASASALFRLMILLLQGSSAFEANFRLCGSFSPFVLSIPRFSLCPNIIISMLSQLLNVPILHLHSLPHLNPEQLCEVFDAESENNAMYSDVSTDPSTGIFALLVECIGRNVHLASTGNDLASKAANTNQAIIKLLLHRHTLSPAFQRYCSTPNFLEPLSQALCLVYDERIQHVRPARLKRQSFLADIPRGLTPTERFVGAPDDSDSTGIGIVRLLRMVIKHCVTSGPAAAASINAVFRSFPIHASPQQVEAFHLILIELCCSVVEHVIHDGNAVSVANCLGICSVFLDQMLGGFFTSEAALKAVNTSILILTKLLKFEEPAMYSLDNAEHNLLALNAAHLANLICVTALRIGLPFDSDDRGDEDLQWEVLQAIDSNIMALLLLPARDRKSNWKVPTGKLSKPPPSAKIYPVWESVSVSRCQGEYETLFPEAGDTEAIDSFTIAPLLVLLYRMLLESRDDVRSLAISVLVALLQYRAHVLSSLLVVEVNRDDSFETIDIISRGGFRALLATHEAATMADKSSAISVKRKYSSFFEWIERNHRDVEIVFNAIERKAMDLFPSLEGTAVPQPEAVLNEQKLMLVELTMQANDRTMLGSLERAELSLICSERTINYHTKWKRQGFDDLAYGAMKWKVLLRQLKGSSSIWEGGPSHMEKLQLSWQDRVFKLENGMLGDEKDSNVELVKRWKLDLSECHERQRRRLLPNYEFHGLYNLDEETEHELPPPNDSPSTSTSIDSKTPQPESNESSSNFIVGGGEVVATAELLRDLKLRKSRKKDQDEDLDETDAEFDEDLLTEATSVTGTTTADGGSLQAVNEESERRKSEVSFDDPVASDGEGGDTLKEEKDLSSYELITGLLQAGDWPLKSYNIRRCNGLEVTQALLLWCKHAIYVIDGFEQTGGVGMEGRITRVEREHSSFFITLRPNNSKVSVEEKSDDELAAGNEKNSIGTKHRTDNVRSSTKTSVSDTTGEVIYEHRSQRILLSDLHAVYRRRYQLQQSALEFYDVHRNAVLIAFEGEAQREEILSKVLQSEIPNSIFSSNYGTYINYAKFMRTLKQKIVTQWQSGKMSNFEFLMHLNSFAGRTFNDITQYPVFPWVIADYDSDEIDLNNPKTYRDLSKPMGALGEERAEQFKERYEALASTDFGEDDPPPFHYGTHYSTAAYVLYYLMRLEPFSRLALALQGGKFDFADRLFHDIGRSWKSASAENLQDVRELIPEFFFLPDFLVNTNNFDFGETQRGKTVHDVSLPKWAKGDPKRFVRINRQALESEYVSKHLHLWIDLIFGYKQRGEQAVAALNTFVHVTYEGVVDLDAMDDPVQKLSTIAQIQNFGQTPSRLERWPFPARTVVSSLRDNSIDFGSLSSLGPLTPALCIVGAPHRVDMKFVHCENCKSIVGQTDMSVGDISLQKGQIIAVPKMCSLIIPSKKYCRFGGLNNGLSIHVAAVTPKFREVNKLISFHDDLHNAPILVATPSRNGNWLVTGAADSTIRVWLYNDVELLLQATLCGHDGSQITCVDVSTECGVIASGCASGKVLLWDLRTLTFVRALRHDLRDEPVLSLSINNCNGNIVTLFRSQLSIFDINGNLLASQGSFETNPPTYAVSTDCPEWMETGVVAVTGHTSGAVCLWSINYDSKCLILKHGLEGNPHAAPITTIKITGSERQDTLLIGDKSGKISLFKTVQLDNYSSTELAKVVDELKAMKVPR